MKIGVQTQNIVDDTNPSAGFQALSDIGFSCADFSLNSYLKNTSIYASDLNDFFSQPVSALEQFFAPHKLAATKAGITVNQMHMPYPVYVPKGCSRTNEYLQKEVAPKSMEICHYFDCPYIVVHGLKMAYYLGTEQAEWEQTEQFIDTIAPMAKEMNITICIENLYDSVAGHLVEGPCCDAHKAVERIDRINEKYHAEVLGFCFDTGHANLVGIDFEQFITALDYRLKVLHIHDNDGIDDLHQIPFTFTRTRENQSSTDWDGFIWGLRNIHFDRTLSFETAPVLNSFPGQLRQDALSMIFKIGKYFSGAVCMGEEV